MINMYSIEMQREQTFSVWWNSQGSQHSWGSDKILFGWWLPVDWGELSFAPGSNEYAVQNSCRRTRMHSTRLPWSMLFKYCSLALTLKQCLWSGRWSKNVDQSSTWRFRFDVKIDLRPLELQGLMAFFFFSHSLDFMVVAMWYRRLLCCISSSFHLESRLIQPSVSHPCWDRCMLHSAEIRYRLMHVPSYSLGLFVVSWNYGLGAITWLWLSEIYPMEIRGHCKVSPCGQLKSSAMHLQQLAKPLSWALTCQVEDKHSPLVES